MTTATQLRHYRPRSAQIIGAVVVLIFCVIYFGALQVLDGRADNYLRELRKSDPTRYLTLLREGQGFDAFLKEYSTIAGYDEFQPMPPNFLIGRWTSRPSPIRLAPGSAPTECSNPMTLGYGLYLPLENGGESLSVTYRIKGQTVEIRNDDLGTMPVTLISYGGQLDHIEFVPPGESEKVYAYLCGR